MSSGTKWMKTLMVTHVLKDQANVMLIIQCMEVLHIDIVAIRITIHLANASVKDV